MTEYPELHSESHIRSGRTDGTPADALHTLLLFVIDNHEQFTEWLQIHSSKAVTEESVIAALSGLDEVLHEAMTPPKRSRVRMGNQEFEDITTAILAALAEAEAEGRKPEDPDANTGQYL